MRHTRLRGPRDTARRHLRPRGGHLEHGRDLLRAAGGVSSVLRRGPEEALQEDQGGQVLLPRGLLVRHLAQRRGPHPLHAVSGPEQALDGEDAPAAPVDRGQRRRAGSARPCEESTGVEEVQRAQEAQGGRRRGHHGQPHQAAYDGGGGLDQARRLGEGGCCSDL